MKRPTYSEVASTWEAYADHLEAREKTLVAALEQARITLYEHGDARYTAPVVEQIEVALKAAKGEA